MAEKLEIERKYLIEMPNIKKLADEFDLIRMDINQTYLTREESGVERRVRRTKVGGKTYYHFTRKEKIKDSNLKRREHEVEIDKKYYNELRREADRSLNTIKKKRYIFQYNGMSVELDVYRFWKKQVIVEVEMDSGDGVIKLPNSLKVIKEVTNDSNYKNYNLAKRFRN